MGEGVSKTGTPYLHSSYLPYSTLLPRQWAAVRTAYGLRSQASHLPLRAGRRPCDVWDSAGVSLWLCPGRRNAPCQRRTADSFCRSDILMQSAGAFSKRLLYPPLHRILMAHCQPCFPFPAGQSKVFLLLDMKFPRLSEGE